MKVAVSTACFQRCLRAFARSCREVGAVHRLALLERRFSFVAVLVESVCCG